MDSLSLEKSLAHGELRPNYVFLAEEPYWVDRLTDALRRALKKKAGEIEERRFEGNEWTLDQLLAELGAFSMFASQRLVRVIEAERIKKADWEKVGGALKEANPTLTVLFVAHKKETFKEAVKQLGASAVSVECLRPKPRDVPLQVTYFAKEEGKVLNPQDSRLLVELIGNDLLTLKNQVTLLSIFVGEKKVIGGEDIQRLFADSSEKESFALTKALSDQDRVQTYSLVKTLLEQGEAPVRLLALLSRHFRLLFKAKLLLKRGEGPSGVATILRLPPFIVEQYLMQAQRFSWKQFIKIYRELSYTDRALKSSPLPAGALLEKFIGNCFG
ncbi:MAG: DNA polymerase III subunit delta [bacterium]